MNRILTIMSLVVLICSPARAFEPHPSRVRLLIHANQPIVEELDLRVHLIPAGNLMNGLAPLVYTGVAYKPNVYINIEFNLGWHFGLDEPLISIKPSVSFGDFWFWSELDLQHPSLSGYWFLQGQYKIAHFLHVGIEGEGWGDYRDSKTWSHGGGPNILLRFGNHVGTDLALHFRDFPQVGNGVELFTRFHLFF